MKFTTKTIALLSIIGIIVIGVIWYVSTSIGISNQEARLRNRFNAEFESRNSHFDKMWKTIKDQIKVSDKYKDAFMETLIKSSEARYGDKENLMFQFVTEQNPAISENVFNNLMNSISVERTGFMNKQDILIDVKREHDDLITTFPGTWFLSGREPLKLLIISSSYTQEVAKTGQDDKDLFEDEK